MDLYPQLLGNGFANREQEYQSASVLDIGSDSFPRGVLADHGFYHVIAAKILSRILKKEFKLRNTKELFDTISPAALALPGLGVTTLACVGAAFAAKGIGGSAPLKNWVDKHMKGHVTTFDTIKHRDQAEVAKEKKELKQRKATRRNTAHRTRVQRYVGRVAEQGAANP